MGHREPSVAMKRPGPQTCTAVAGFIHALLFLQPGAASPEKYALSGLDLGASGKSIIYVALCQLDGFLERQVQQIQIKHGAELVFRFEIPADGWAVSAFEDRNGNGIPDMGLFGPKEPSGFWSPFTGRDKPRFDEVT